MRRAGSAISVIRVTRLISVISVALAGVVLTMTVDGQSAPASKGITAVPGIRVGHFTLPGGLTGCSVVLADGEGAVGGVSQRGGAPGTRETDLLDPLNLVDRVNAVVLSGGSAFGLDAAQGVVKFLEEKNIGYKTNAGVVPIVPAAILLDLGFGGNKTRPTADCGYRAAGAASDGRVAEGNVGAGAGATVGKIGGGRKPMKAGIARIDDVGFSTGSACQHGQAKMRWYGRRNSILIGNKFQNDGSASRFERGLDLGHQLLAGWRIEVVEEICDHHKVVVFAIFHIKSAAWNRPVAP